MKYKAVIFDMDGTVLDTLGDLTVSTNYALNASGFPQRTKAEVMSFVGSGVERLMRLSVPEGTDEVAFQACLSVFREHYAANSRVLTKPYNGIPQLMRKLKASGISIAIASNKFQSAVSELCEVYFPGLVDVAVGEQQGIPKKPAPDFVYECMKLLESNDGNTVFIGDSDVDIQTAKNAGLKSIGVLWGFRSKDVLIALGADYLAEAPSDIERIIFNDSEEKL